MKYLISLGLLLLTNSTIAQTNMTKQECQLKQQEIAQKIQMAHKQGNYYLLINLEKILKETKTYCGHHLIAQDKPVQRKAYLNN